MNSPYRALRQHAATPSLRWLLPLLDEAEHLLRSGPHGDLPTWQSALAQLPNVVPGFEDGDAPALGAPAPDAGAVTAALLKLQPWRKGPLRLAGVHIDTEWRSDWKWRRIAP
ncbi:MAG: DUF1698 domain-containing protein, partial [Xanthomonadales bacterium]|nr:DUF1698 domain-containing protein [Xanthomonadales bacterium]